MLIRGVLLYVSMGDYLPKYTASRLNRTMTLMLATMTATDLTRFVYPHSNGQE